MFSVVWFGLVWFALVHIGQPGLLNLFYNIVSHACDVDDQGGRLGGIAI